MRILSLVFVLLLTFPALAQGRNAYVNARYGATVDIPSGFEAMGVEGADSEGMTFRSRQGAIITIFGVATSGGFENTVEYWIERAQSYDGWNITGKTVTPDWAEYSAKVGGRQLRVRMISACGGRHALAAKVQFDGNLNSMADSVLHSLKEGAARAC